MIIEHYRDQDLKELREKVIYFYKRFAEENLMTSDQLFYWHPETEGEYNDTWKVIKVLERYGYPSYYYDSVLYTFEFSEFDNPEKFVGDGLTFNQAVCNLFVSYGLAYEKRNLDRKI